MFYTHLSMKKALFPFPNAVSVGANGAVCNTEHLYDLLVGECHVLKDKEGDKTQLQMAVAFRALMEPLVEGKGIIVDKVLFFLFCEVVQLLPPEYLVIDGLTTPQSVGPLLLQLLNLTVEL